MVNHAIIFSRDYLCLNYRYLPFLSFRVKLHLSVLFYVIGVRFYSFFYL
jgi:hypothetical protein